jgi:hypothetical protein
LPVGLIEKARDVVLFSPGLTMASFMEEALVAQLERAEKRCGELFPSRAGAAHKTGRPASFPQYGCKAGFPRGAFLTDRSWQAAVVSSVREAAAKEAF